MDLYSTSDAIGRCDIRAIFIGRHDIEAILLDDECIANQSQNTSNDGFDWMDTMKIFFVGVQHYYSAE